jgi:hypothetical protein
MHHQVIQALVLQLLEIMGCIVRHNLVELFTCSRLEELAGLVRDIESGPVADDRLEAGHIGIVDGSHDIRVKLLGPLVKSI